MPYVVGTAAGTLPWAGLYAVCGAYGRKLLDGGEALDQVFDDLSGLIEGDVEIASEVAAAGVAVAGLAWGVRTLATRGNQATEDP
mmetsp:Transcript_35094/g.56377  ORF Transcript_35094/g.56377 Transcript_35094/m.56377 type:complete len:85 (+) Transcript_35094:103-357(+)